jgi:hypothetical protein
LQFLNKKFKLELKPSFNYVLSFAFFMFSDF